MGSQEMGPLFLVWPLFRESKKHERLKLRKSFETPNGSTRNACCLRHAFTRTCFFPQECCTS